MSAYRLTSGSLVVPEVGRECAKCFVFRRWDQFHAQADGHLGHHAYCKQCSKARLAAHYEANREQLLARDAARYEANREQILARHAAYRDENREQLRAQQAAHYEANREQILARQAAYRAEVLGCRPGWHPGVTNATNLARSQEKALSACFLYVLRMWDVDGMPFLKVGLGGQGRINRHLRRHPDNTVLVQMASTRAACFYVEQLLLDTLQPSYRYEPVEQFAGHTECVTAAAPVGWLFAEVAHLLLDPEDDDAIEVAIQRTIDACVAEHERLSEES